MSRSAAALACVLLSRTGARASSRLRGSSVDGNVSSDCEVFRMEFGPVGCGVPKWEALCPPNQPCLEKLPVVDGSEYGCPGSFGQTCWCEGANQYAGRHEPYGCERDMIYISGPEWTRSFEPLGGGRNAACRGDNNTDMGAGRFFKVHHPIFRLRKCRELCTAEPRCVGIEFNQDQQRCEVWTRDGGIHSWAVPAAAGYTCERYGWPVQHLRPMHGGTDRACRGGSTDDNSEDYYTLRITETLEECKAACAASPVCAGVEFSADIGRCEIWSHEIKATAERSGFTCLQYNPDPPVPQSTTFTTSPHATQLVQFEFVSTDPDCTKRGCVQCQPSSGILICDQHVTVREEGEWYFVYDDIVYDISVDADQVCATRTSDAWLDFSHSEPFGVECLTASIGTGSTTAGPAQKDAGA